MTDKVLFPFRSHITVEKGGFFQGSICKGPQCYFIEICLRLMKLRMFDHDPFCGNSLDQVCSFVIKGAGLLLILLASIGGSQMQDPCDTGVIDSKPL